MRSPKIPFRLPSRSLLGILMPIAVALISLSARPANAAAADATPTPSPPPATPSLAEVRVTDAYRLGRFKEQDPLKRNTAGIGDIIVVKVKNLKNLVNTAKCLSEDDKQVPNCREQNIALFLDGREIKGIVPESGAPLPEDETLQFHLQRSADSDEAWADLLGAPPFGGDKFTHRPTEVSVGFAGSYALPSDVKEDKFKLVRIRGTRLVICTILLIIVFILLLALALFSEMLRDVGPAPAKDASKKWWRQPHKPYSLARFQMAVWFFLVVASLLFIWQITGAYDIITATALALVGIGAGTALGAAAVDAGKNQANSSQLDALKAEEATLTSEIAALDSQINAPAPPPNLNDLQQTKTAKVTRLNLIQTQITDLSTAVAAKTSTNFLNDILTDGDNGISFHRFQMFVWTLVLGVIFVYGVWYRLAMPEFSATLLALLGISSGTYLGFKIPEKQS